MKNEERRISPEINLRVFRYERERKLYLWKLMHWSTSYSTNRSAQQPSCRGKQMTDRNLQRCDSLTPSINSIAELWLQVLTVHHKNVQLEQAQIYMQTGTCGSNMMHDAYGLKQWIHMHKCSTNVYILLQYVIIRTQLSTDYTNSI